MRGQRTNGTDIQYSIHNDNTTLWLGTRQHSGGTKTRHNNNLGRQKRGVTLIGKLDQRRARTHTRHTAHHTPHPTRLGTFSVLAVCAGVLVFLFRSFALRVARHPTFACGKKTGIRRYSVTHTHICVPLLVAKRTGKGKQRSMCLRLENQGSPSVAWLLLAVTARDSPQSGESRNERSNSIEKHVRILRNPHPDEPRFTSLPLLTAVR